MQQVDRAARARAERLRRRRASFPLGRAWEAQRTMEEVAGLRGQVAELTGAVQALTAHAFPEADFDSGWEDLAPNTGKRWTWEAGRRIERADVLLQTGPDSFEPVPLTPREGDVFARPETNSAGDPVAYYCYSRSPFPVRVRIQGWYA